MPKTESVGSADVGTLAQEYDCLLIDLDGTVFRGHEPTEGAVSHWTRCAAASCSSPTTHRAAPTRSRRICATSGLPPTADDVVTSAQSAARVLAAQLAAGVAGVDRRHRFAGQRDRGRRAAAGAPATTTTRTPSSRVLPDDIGWRDLAEAALAIRAGALWVAANVDATLPTERGLLPGNGSMVAALQAATERRAPGRGQAGADADAGCGGPRRLSRAVGDR